MKTCHLKNLTSIKNFYEQIAFAFEFPAHFGRNMDALWDTLTDVEGPLELIWEQPGVSRDALGEDYWLLLEILADAVAERDDFTLTLRG
ncbi:barstar family protein [Sulfuriferula thiophila]|uniref:barstar family protein n=1 Tax=Sulfuriferula thiophila TaxID=1781211 RepID=UPI000F60AB07|nr:barstar family protein [Sulfuriferula thiophila]